MTVDKKDYYTTREAARLLKVAVSTVQLWVDDGSLRAWSTAGGHRRIACDSVDEMLNEQTAMSARPNPRKKLSIVVVEDDASQRRLYEKHISKWRLDVDLVIAKDGYEGLIKIGNILPDIIITDLMMPNVDGFQMIRALKVIPELQKAVVIAASALGKSDVKSRGGLPDGVHLFTKPFSFADMEEFIDEKLAVRAAS